MSSREYIPRVKSWIIPQHKCDYIPVERVGPIGHVFIVMKCKICGREYVPDPGYYSKG